MSEKLEPYKVRASKFLGRDDNDNYTYEITLNQSIVHIGRFTGIEEGLDHYRQKEIENHEQDILNEAEEIKNRKLTSN